MSENECVEKPALKLYIVGESSGDAKDWSPYSNVALVVAENETAAMEMTDRDAAVAEVDMTKARVLVHMSYDR
jgi:hypothetical protein